jgi:gamma-glutamylcyclotransferase (GGCT)/AIG2-like uncharacterized protein YtfP
MENLFVYGSLMCEDIMFAVTGTLLRSSLAVLPGYRRFSVKNELYPAVIPSDGHQVEGLVYHGLSAEDLIRLDRFEEGMYDRRPVRVRVKDGARIQAFCYVCRPEFRQELTDQDWDFDRFLADGKKIFQARYPGFGHPGEKETA